MFCILHIVCQNLQYIMKVSNALKLITDNVKQNIKKHAEKENIDSTNHLQHDTFINDIADGVGDNDTSYRNNNNGTVATFKYDMKNKTKYNKAWYTILGAAMAEHPDVSNGAIRNIMVATATLLCKDKSKDEIEKMIPSKDTLKKIMTV